jgi:hypothetical protein
MRRGDYLRNKGEKTSSKGPLMLNIRVRHVKRRGERKTMVADVKAALQTLLDTGSMPPGWQFMVVNWKNPKKFGTSWDTGWPRHARTSDAEEFRNAFSAAVQSMMRVATVRKL